VRTMLAELGAAVIDADRVGHEVYLPGTPGFDAVVANFGRGIVDPEGRIDRPKLGAIVFSDPAKLAQLNAIVHPLIQAEIVRRIDEERRRGTAPAVIVEAAVLLEAGWDRLVDEVWLVVADREDVLRRLSASRGLSRADSEARIARQMSDDERRKASTVVIENRGTLEELRSSVADAWSRRIRH
jgi:dephospho-CoA kinase